MELTYTSKSIVLLTRGTVPAITVSKWNTDTFATEPAINFNAKFSPERKKRKKNIDRKHFSFNFCTLKNIQKNNNTY